MSPGYIQSAFSATSVPTSCVKCTSAKAEYTNTLAHKQEEACQQCDVPKVILVEDLGTCVTCAAVSVVCWCNYSSHAHF